MSKELVVVEVDVIERTQISMTQERYEEMLVAISLFNELIEKARTEEQSAVLERIEKLLGIEGVSSIVPSEATLAGNLPYDIHVRSSN